MAQLNIAFFSEIGAEERHQFAIAARDIAAKEVHHLAKEEIKPDSVSVLVLPVDTLASLSGAEIEVQVLISGNDWPQTEGGRPLSASDAKVHFDKLAGQIYEELTKTSRRPIYVWVTPFTVSGWAE